MKYSDIGMKILAAKECGIIKTNAQFWGTFSDRERFDKEVLKNDRVIKATEKLSREFDSLGSEEGMTCVFDKDFPVISSKVKNNGDKPYLLFYKGDLSLLHDLNNNVAVIGLTDPDDEISKRETDIVEKLVDNGLVIVSGLARGCDTNAHRTCLKSNGKTIAILPSQLNKIYPAENLDLAEDIVRDGGLLISEYYKDSTSRNEAIKRFIERDRLQAMFSKAIILIASYRKDEGDSGSRHAMEAASKYEIERYAMYNSRTDDNKKQFGLNKDLVEAKGMNQVKILQISSIEHIKVFKNQNLTPKANLHATEQITLLKDL